MVVIVGGGFSGTMLTVQLLNRSSTALSIVVVNRGSKPGRGIAYETNCDEQVLNVRAGKMSAVPDDAEHFLRWLQASGFALGAEDFAPRRLYGVYVEETLQEAIKRHPDSRVSWIDGNAISLTLKADKPLLTLENGYTVVADFAVLATGNAPPSIPAQLRSLTKRFFAAHAWADDALEEIPPSGTVLILGSGLTAIDQVLALRARNFQGTIFLLSRNGRLPAADFPSSEWSTDWLSIAPDNISSIVAHVRQQVKVAIASGSSWHAVIDSLRQRSPQIWQNLSVADRKRFLRHVRPHWEVARHRIPMKTHDNLQRLLNEGQLHVIAGRLRKVKENHHCVEITLCRRGEDKERSLTVDRIINCTGSPAEGRLHEPLMRGLLGYGLARLESLELGLDTAPDGALISRSGKALASIYSLGPVRKASLWETTAVPEIRSQTVQVAEQILTKLQFL